LVALASCTLTHPNPNLALLAVLAVLAVIHHHQNFELQPAPQTATPAQRDNSPIFANHVHDFLPHHPRPVSQIHLSAWLTSALSVWRTWMSFRTPVFTMIFEMREQWRHRPRTCQRPIPAQQPPNNLLLSSNPAIMFYTTSVCGNGRRKQIAARFVATHSMSSRYSTELEVRSPFFSTTSPTSSHMPQIISGTSSEVCGLLLVSVTRKFRSSERSYFSATSHPSERGSCINTQIIQNANSFPQAPSYQNIKSRTKSK